MNKCHTNINWVNDTTPAINDTNLNYMDGCIDTIDDRVISLDTTKANQSDLLTAFKDVSLDSSTGVITFTLFNNTTKTIDTLLEKIAVNFDYDDDPTSAHYQNLIIELEDGTFKYIDMSALITEYEFVDSSTVAFTVGLDGSVSASVIDGSITASKLQPNYLADVTAQATIASNAATTSNANQLLSEGYANGTQGGVPVSSGSPYYHNNAKYWKEQAQSIAGGSISGLSDVSIVNPQDGQALTYDSTNQEWVNSTPVQTLSDLTDTDINLPADGDVLTYDSVSGEWQNKAASPGLLPHVAITTTTGATVTLTDGVTTITATETSAGVYEADVERYGTWTVVATIVGASGSTTINVDTVKVYSVTIALFMATITVNYPDSMRGETFTCVNGGVTLTETAPNNANTFNFYATNAGTWAVTGEYTKSAVIAADGDVVTLTFIALKTFATATDAEIAAMVAEADAGYIDLYDDAGWRVGQEHQVSLSAINSSGTYDGVTWSVGESQGAQTVTLVLMHKGVYELVTPVINKDGTTRNTCSFVVGMKNCSERGGYINSNSSANTSWDGCDRRKWCNGGIRSAIPSTLQSAFKQFKTITIELGGSSTTLKTSYDYFALPAECEVYDTPTRGTQTEADAVTQFDWYKTAANRIKSVSISYLNRQWWWFRTPHSNPSFSAYFTGAQETGEEFGQFSNSEYGLSPFGCL